MIAEKRDPWSKFYWSDWRSDPKLRMCSLAARGLWVEMLAVMNEAEPCGYLLVNGEAPTDKQLAKMFGSTAAEIKRLKAELAASGVPSIDERGIWHSRRMVRDAKRREINRKNGQSGGNPALTGTDVNSDNQIGYPNGITGLDNGSDKARATRGPEARSQSQMPDAKDNTQSDLSSEPLPDTPRPAASPSHMRYAEVSQRISDILANPNLLVFGRVDVWLKSGADPEADIYPTLERMKANWKGSNLKYFDGAIADALATRTAPLASGAANSNSSRFSPNDIIRSLPKDA